MPVDPVAGGLAAFSAASVPASIPARHEAVRRLLDVIAIAVASRDDEAVVAARRLAQPLDNGASIWGQRGGHEWAGAALVNSVAARYRDINDAYFNRESLHPSDMIPALAALAELEGASLGRLLDAIRRAYDVAVDLADTWRTSSRGADHSNLILLGSVAGAGNLIGLEEDRLVEAFSIAGSAGISTRQVRRGNLTMWKGFAAGAQAIAGVRAVRLAQAGVRGPTKAFTGDQSFQAVAVDESTRIDTYVPSDGARQGERILDTHQKVYPVGYLGQATVGLAIELHDELVGHEPLSMRIVSFRRAKEIMADPEKWQPDSSETADHSLPYTATVALLDGRFDIDSLALARRDASDVKRLLPNVEVIVDGSMTAAYPGEMAARVEVTRADGVVVERSVRWPLGHAQRPLSDEALVARAAEMMRPVLGDRATDVAETMLVADHDGPASALLDW